MRAFVFNMAKRIVSAIFVPALMLTLIAGLAVLPGCDKNAGGESGQTEVSATEAATPEATEADTEKSAAEAATSEETEANAEKSAAEPATPEATEAYAETADDKEPEEQPEGGLEVHFIDVGQGDATLIICGDEAMLVDAGDEDGGTAIQRYLKDHNVEKLKYVVATHPDADHIGGMDVVIYKFDCDEILIPNCEKDSPAFDRLQDAIKAKGYTSHVVDVGEKYTLGDARIEILSPSVEFLFAEVNDSSIVFRLDYGDNSFLFTGDATIPPQQALIYDPDLDIDVDVLKVPHHGASSAYIKGFYDEVSPVYAVISCGRENRYGHPTSEVLNDLKNRGTKLFRTDEQGTIIATSDGKTITFSTEPSETWKPGEIYVPESEEIDPASGNADGFQHNLSAPPAEGVTYVYNKNSEKFHLPTCESVTDMNPKNREDLNCTREELLEMYPWAQPCRRCKP